MPRCVRTSIDGFSGLRPHLSPNRAAVPKTAAAEEIPHRQSRDGPFPCGPPGRRVPAGLAEVARLGRTLKKRADDVLAFLTAPASATAPQRPSMGASSTYAASRWASATSTTTSPAAPSKPAGSDSTYTLDWEEPLWVWRSGSHGQHTDVINVRLLASVSARGGMSHTRWMVSHHF